MKKLISILLSVIMVLSFTACGTKAEASWQEQYDQGLKYVSEAKYEDAIIAFNKALEIDPKKADIYIKLSNVYNLTDNYEKAEEILMQGYENTADEERDKIMAEISRYSNEVCRTERVNLDNGGWIDLEFTFNDFLLCNKEYDKEGVLIRYHKFEYFPSGEEKATTTYTASGIIQSINENDINGNLIRSEVYNEDGSLIHHEEYSYNEAGNKVSTTYFYDDSIMVHYEPEDDGTYNIEQYDLNWNLKFRTFYDSQYNIISTEEF